MSRGHKCLCKNVQTWYCGTYAIEPRRRRRTKDNGPSDWTRTSQFPRTYCIPAGTCEARLKYCTSTSSRALDRNQSVARCGRHTFGRYKRCKSRRIVNEGGEMWGISFKTCKGFTETEGWTSAWNVLEFTLKTWTPWCSEMSGVAKLWFTSKTCWECVGEKNCAHIPKEERRELWNPLIGDTCKDDTHKVEKICSCFHFIWATWITCEAPLSWGPFRHKTGAKFSSIASHFGLQYSFSDRQFFCLLCCGWATWCLL